MLKFTCGAVAVTAAAVVLMACGTGGPAGQQVAGTRPSAAALRDTSTKRAVFAMTSDCSGFGKYAPDYLDDMVAVAGEVSAGPNPGKIVATCLDGSPLRTARMTTVDFAVVPDGLSPSDRTKFNEARVAGLRHTFAKLISEKEVVSGSGLLEGLEVLAHEPGVTAIYMWTDGVVNQIDGIDITRATPAEIRQTAQRWIPRVKKLAGIPVYVIGVGRGVSTTSTVRKSHRLFARIVDGAGGRLVWAQSLDQAGGA